VDRPALNTEPCPGDCHSGDFADFDHYCDENNIPESDTHIAFAAWLNGRTGWDGDVEEFSP
jgi:hypothetical protein